MTRRGGILGPVPSRAGEVALHPLRRQDGGAWRRLRLADKALLRPWDVTSPLSWAERHGRRAWSAHRRELRAAENRGEAHALAIRVDDVFAGQVTIGGIQGGALRSGWVGYWVGSPWQHRGVATCAVALAVDAALGAWGLHRIEATVAPENAASRRVVERLGFRTEGLLRRYLDVDGGWHDHVLYALTSEDLRPPLTVRLPGLLASSASSGQPRSGTEENP